MSTRAQIALTEEELEAFLDAINTRSTTGKRNLALLTLMADTGIRVGEALGLQTGDIVFEHGQITGIKLRHTKSGSAANVSVPQRAAVRLAAWLDEREDQGIGNGAVFCTISKGKCVHPDHGDDGFKPDTTTETQLQPGKAISPTYVAQVVTRLADRAGIEQRVTPHTLRHTFATHMLRKTGNLQLVSKALRHADVTTTARIYTHLEDKDVADAVQQLREPEEEEEDTDVDALAERLQQLSDDERAVLADILAPNGG